MKVVVVGVVSVALGAALSVSGLLIAGGIWVVAGLVGYAHKNDLQAKVDARKQRAAADSDPETDPENIGQLITGPEFFRGTLVLLLIGAPALALGLLGVGFEGDDEAWRWFPVAFGGLWTGIALVSGLMYTLGSGMEAVAEEIGVPEHPGTITIRAMRQTGTYINEMPRVEFELTVEPEGLPSYEVTKKATVPHIALGSLRVGSGFRAKVLPEKPEVMEIDWGSPVGSPATDQDPSARLEELDELRDAGRINAEEYEAQRRRILDSI